MISKNQLQAEGLYLDITADGGSIFVFDSESPQLVVPLDLKQVGSRNESLIYELGTLYGVLRSGYGPDQCIVAESHPTPVERLAHYGERNVQLTFPLTLQVMSLLEKKRSGREQLELILHLKLSGRKLIPVERVNNAYLHAGGFVGHASDMRLYVPRDRWLSALESAKFGSIHVFEFPAVPLEPGDGLKNAFAALQEAKRLHMNGFYDMSVAQCRVALDKFWDDRPKRLLDQWKAYMSAEEHEWLGLAFTAIRRGANATHHEARPGHDQLESLVFINMTASLVAYVARMGVEEKASG